MLNGLSLFTGYGGIDMALREWVRPILYCEIEQYAQGIILSRMDDGGLPFAPVWNDVTTLDGGQFKGLVDIVYGGFPCQDISVAGKGAGLEGKRSGLFYEIIRICKEASPLFIFLENVPAIRTRGAVEVTEALANIGYDCRFHHLSAAEVGANHKRERWFLLAHANHNRRRESLQQVSELGGQESSDSWGNGESRSVANADSVWELPKQRRNEGSSYRSQGEVAHPNGEGLEGYIGKESTISEFAKFHRSEWWKTEPDVGRVADGVAFRPHRIKALGNGVVPLQVKTAFEKLIGIER